MGVIENIITQTVKSADAGNLYPSQYVGLTQQNFFPVSQRRKLSGEEIAFIEKEKSKWFPKIFKSMGDHPAEDMHSPAVMAVLQGLLGAGLGGAIGQIATRNPNNPSGITPGALLGFGLGGLIGSGLGYFTTEAKNNTILDMISRIPEGGTRRDVLADPVYAQLALMPAYNKNQTQPLIDNNKTNLPNWLLAK